VRALSESDQPAPYHSPGAAEVLCTVLALAMYNVQLMCYCFDLPEGVATLSFLMGKRVIVHLLVCKSQMRKPSCSQQYERMLKLCEAEGAEECLRIKEYSPGTGGFSALHAKSWCVDEMVYIGASLRVSRNAAMNNEEHLIELKDPLVFKRYKGSFDDIWQKAEIVTKGGKRSSE
jgi:hypothetical protein